MIMGIDVHAGPINKSGTTKIGIWSYYRCFVEVLQGICNVSTSAL